MAVFQIDGLIFGIMISNDSNYAESARGLPQDNADVAAQAREVDIALAIDHGVFVIRADVAGRTDGTVSYGSSRIVDSRGRVLQSTQPLTAELIVADLEVSRREPRAIP